MINTCVHVIVTVGELKKEAMLNARVQLLQRNSESLLDGAASFDISISGYIKKFKLKGSIVYIQVRRKS